MVETFLALGKLNEKLALGKMRFMTDCCGERYGTLVAECDAPSVQACET